MMSTDRKDYYSILGVPKEASSDDIKKAYRKLAMQHHPDRNKGDLAAEAKFKEINEANDILSDDQKRAAYDNPAPQMGGFNPFGDNSPFSFHFTSGPGGNPHDIFANIFADINRGRQQRNRDINLEYQVSLEDIFNGKEAEIKYNVGGGPVNTLIVKIPPGIEEGTKLRFGGQGEKTIQNIPPGDLYITIQIARHNLFVRSGKNNLITCANIDYIDAILGTSVMVPIIEGGQVKVNVPKGVKPGQNLRVAGKGMKDQSGNRGDLLVELILNVPTLSETQIKKLESIKKLDIKV